MKKFWMATLVLSLFCADLFCCTSAIITGRLTRDGRPLMWKHRDTGEENNRIAFFQGKKYAFLALANSPVYADEAWTGVNTAGFSIMNTASYNLKDDKVASKYMDKEGVLMFEALSVCRTLSDFEKMLDNYKRPMGVEANFGVIDAEGGAAYYEVNNDSWTKIDVNDPKIAPQGYLVYTNYSYTGRPEEGMGYIRYTTADGIIKRYIGEAGIITPEWIFSTLSRSFFHSLLGVDLIKDHELLKRGSGWFVDQDFIPRKSSTASIVVQGVKPGEDPLHTVMWTLLGYPPASVAVPLFVSAGKDQPGFMIKAPDSDNARLCDLSLELKHRVFPVVRGNGEKYMNFNLLYNSSGNGYMQMLAPVEKQIAEKGCVLIEKMYRENKTPDSRQLEDYYNWVHNLIEDAFRSAGTVGKNS